MCSSGQPLCSGSRRSPRNVEGNNSGSQYALCALGVGLVALGIVMIVWSIVPSEVTQLQNGTIPVPNDGFPKGKGKSSSVAFVLVGAGIAMLLLAICVGVRNKKRMRQRETAEAGSPEYVDRVPGEQDEASNEAPSYDVPTYEEAVTSGQYPVRQSNLRQSYQLPSYEDLIAAVESEGQQPKEGYGQEAPQPAPGPGPQAAAPTSSSQPARSSSSSRASRILRPLRVRRIKSEKLHLKDIRLNIQSPAQGGVVTIEPLTPPPQYEDKPPQLPTEAV
ncbi:transmembrane protein 51-like [Myxocyprinus asiaticus]|uniref:transmembrane protein 51-like n=1 Tax=Myxocyprinus asiaticus TaxID=70543 RepID=UPI002223530B|nr:transmembrane protein 51-like [Myxocyprinus asiaticus]